MKILVYIIFMMNVFSAFAQDPVPEDKKAAITIGFLKGGGSLIGADLEYLFAGKIGAQLGAGFVGYGAGLNYHLKPTVRSSFISLQYWHQGVGDSFAQSVVGPNFVFRAKKILSAQLGFGFPLAQGPAWPDDVEQPSVMLMYAIGIYLPL